MAVALLWKDTLYAVPALVTVCVSQACVLATVALVVGVNVNLSDAISRSMSTEHRVDVSCCGVPARVRERRTPE